MEQRGRKSTPAIASPSMVTNVPSQTHLLVTCRFRLTQAQDEETEKRIPSSDSHLDDTESNGDDELGDDKT